MISSASRFTSNDGEISHETIDGEVILIHLRTGAYYSLLNSGAWIWSRIVDGESFGRVRDALMERFPNAGELEGMLREFYQHLVDESLVVQHADTTEDAAVVAPALPTDDLTMAAFETPKLEVFTDMKALLLLDPIHEVDQAGWPLSQPDVAPFGEGPEEKGEPEETSS